MFSLGVGGSIGHEHEFCQAQNAENTDPRTNYAIKYATARGHLDLRRGKRTMERAPALVLEGSDKWDWSGLCLFPIRKTTGREQMGGGGIES